MEFVEDFCGDGNDEGPRFQGWKVNWWLEIWKQPGSLHEKCCLDFYFIYEMDLVMEVGRSDGTISSRGVNHVCCTP